MALLLTCIGRPFCRVFPAWRILIGPFKFQAHRPSKRWLWNIWNTQRVLFSFKTGNKSERGSILTPEGEETLSMAQAVLRALVESISNASVTVEILVLLQKYRKKFLDLLSKTTFTSAKDGIEANTRQEGEKILDERIGKIQEFRAVKEKVVSFVNMCDLIGPGEISLSIKEVFTICTSLLMS